MRSIHILGLLIGLASAQQSCRFALQYASEDLLSNSTIREQFLEEALSWEANFVREIGVDARSGITFDGQQLDVKTGLPFGSPHLFTASSKESIHVSILARALNGDKLANIFYTQEEALDMATLKIGSYEQFAEDYPGYGGFLPWMQVNPTNVTPTWDWTFGVPSLDNGQLFWAAYGLAAVLEEKYPEQADLAQRWNNFWQTMAKNSVKIFYQGNGQIRTVTAIKNLSLSVDKNTYTNGNTNCVSFDNPCYLDDPYEGELFAFMMHLFAPLGEIDRNAIWNAKRFKLQAVNYHVEELDQDLTVQKGWWFSSHEQWKYLFLPYLDSEINKRVFMNGEKARTWDANANQLPGMFASVSSTIASNDQQILYLSDCGIQEISYEKVGMREVVTPYSAMPLFLADQATAAVWYHNMLSGPAGQTKYGSVEALHINGSQVSPLTTWDSKITTVVAMMGGLSDIIAAKLKETDAYDTFIDKVNEEWELVFGDNLVGDDVDFALPSAQFPSGRDDFVTCRLNIYPDDFAWGVATASYQIEGAYNIDGKGVGIWDNFVNIPGAIVNGDKGDVADDFYHRYQEDIDQMQSMGIKHFRMSFSWPRLLPDGTSDNVNQLGVDFYNNLFDALDAAGIEYFVTLFHWDLPAALMKNSSTDAWLSRDIIDQFNDYADFCFKTFGGRVKHWITFNEPQSFAWLGYGSGYNAPGRCSSYYREGCIEEGDTQREPYLASHIVLLAHAKAVQTYRTTYQTEQGGLIGMCTQSEFAEPWDPSNQDDIDIIDTKVQFDFGWYNDPIHFGNYPQAMIDLITDDRLPTFTEEEQAMLKGSYDFLGLNHYTSKYVHYTGDIGMDWSTDGRFWESSTNINGDLIGPVAESDWLNVYPEGLRKLLKWIDTRYGHQQVYVFENGVSVPGESKLPIDEAIHDQFRQDYYAAYINSVQLAIQEDGVDVRGYFAWSILDNFEWSAGFNVRFGMTYVDYNDNQTRYIKDSGKWYSSWVKNHTYEDTTTATSANVQIYNGKQDTQYFLN